MSQLPTLITGASGGVGFALVQELLKRGHTNLLCHYRTSPDRLRDALSHHGIDPEGRVFHADLRSFDETARMHRDIHALHGPIHALVNLAGASSNAMSWKLSPEAFRDVLDANVLTTFMACREFIPEMREQSRGRIINISSIVAYTGVVGAAHYAAAKAAVAAFSKSLALELAPKNVSVATIALGYFGYGMIETIRPEDQERIKERIPARRFGEARELAGLVEYLLSDSGTYSSGQVYHLNGGLY